MATEAAAFETFDESLKLDPRERGAAEACHNEIGDILDAEDYTVGRFLQGSFARKTMIKPLRDIDMVVLLHPNLQRYLGDEIRAGVRAGAAGGPAEVMAQLQQALEPHYPGASFAPGKHALTIDFGDEGFKFDAVPAFDTGGPEPADVLIANTETGGWERSNTRQLIKVVADRNGATNGRFIRQVRMIKHAVSTSPIADDFFGLLSESVTFDAVKRSLPHAEACLRTFVRGSELLAGTELLDPTGEDNLLRKLDTAALTAARDQFERWQQLAARAHQYAADGDDDAANELWYRIFGAPFPAPAAESVRAAALAWQGGAPTETGRISTARTNRTVAPPGRSWRSR